MKNKMLSIILIFFLLVLTGTSTFAQGIKQRMKDRLPTINALKQNGIVGENNKGFLEFRGGRKNADVVAAENADRKKVYEAIAKSQGTTVDLVGKRRALQLRNIARPGEWLQDEKGKWYKK